MSTETTTGGHALTRWSESERQWLPLGKDVAAVQISAAPDGSLWAATEAYAVFRYAQGKWSNVQGLAREVSIGPDDAAWILTMDPSPGGYELYAAPPGGRFRRVQPLGAGNHIAAAGVGEVWVGRDGGDVRLLRDGKYRKQPGKLIGVTASQDGRAWGLTASPDGASMNVIQWTDHGWKDIGSVP